MAYTLNLLKNRIRGTISPMIYGHFIEHFHRQIYDGIYDPETPLSDEDGFRTDILEAMRKIQVPILRWPGGCFVSSYHWKDAVGPDRIPFFDKAWRVEDPNTFGTDEYVKLCRKIGCEPYICTNAGTGTAEEMSDWVEYCNLENEGRYAKWRIQNGFTEPHKVRYWSIGNENYGHWEIGAKTATEWGVLVRESAKMMKHVDPETELSAAALSDIDWNINLLKNCGRYLDWISIHQYWDMMPEIQNPASYEQCMAWTDSIDRQVNDIRGILTAMHLEKQIKIAFDEWNLRSWHHPNVHTLKMGVHKDEYITPRDKNDINSTYTMADAVFSACFLNAMARNCDIVGMANFAPILNTRGCIYSYDEGLVLRSTYHVFDLFVNHLGDTVIDSWSEDPMPTLNVLGKDEKPHIIDTLDILATCYSDRPGLAISVVNKHPSEPYSITLQPDCLQKTVHLYSITSPSVDSYNDVNRNEIYIHESTVDTPFIMLEPHSVNIIHIM